MPNFWWEVLGFNQDLKPIIRKCANQLIVFVMSSVCCPDMSHLYTRHHQNS